MPITASILNGWVGAAMLLGTGIRDVPAQLAITEVMSWSSTNLGPNRVDNGSDFWELTNLGTNAIALRGYVFADHLNDPMVPLVAPGAPDLFIQPNESIVFVRTDETTNELHFRTWWGLPTNAPQVRMYPKNPGFDREVDGVRLYNPAGVLVDQVDFGIARRGVTFVYDPSSGEFGKYSVLGECGTFKAATADDIGSPGTNCGPVPMRILECPLSQSACAGTEAIFSVRAAGLPRPQYQWQRDGTNLPGATGSSLVLTNVSPVDAGEYAVEINNGATVLRCTNFWLTVSTDLSPPQVLAAPVNAEVYVGQNAKFSVTVCAYPPASYQWFSNHVEILGATNRTLRVADCALEMSGTHFCVRATNWLGSNHACARLVVTRKPKLRFTEVMPRPSTNCPGTADWFEITNQDTNTYNLLGYRFCDEAFSLTGAPVITEPVVLVPGESVILVEQMTPAQFIDWWGATNLVPGVKIIRYAGIGLSYRGDALYLWNAAAEHAADYIASISYAGCPDPEPECPSGVSIHFSESGSCRNGGWAIYGCDSEVGVGGAFQAAQCGDIGSPGYTPNAPPRLVSLTRHGSSFTLKWVATQGKWYRLEYMDELTQTTWVPLGTFPATGSVVSAEDMVPGDWPQRFYRVVELP